MSKEVDLKTCGIRNSTISFALIVSVSVVCFCLKNAFYVVEIPYVLLEKKNINRALSIFIQDHSRRRHKKSSREPLDLKTSIDQELHSVLDKPDINKDRSPRKLQDFGFDLTKEEPEELQQNGVSTKSKSTLESMISSESNSLHDGVEERPKSRSKSRRSTDTG